jgi:hypothetical protein
MTNELIRVFDPETARAIEEAAKATGKSIDVIAEGGKYLGWSLGDLPRDLIGVIAGDWLKHKRIRRWAELCAETIEILEARGNKNREEVSPSVAIPLIEAAIDEDRDVLKQLWAKLFAAAMDPNRAHLVRPSLIQVLKQLDPLDALVLEKLATNNELPAVPGNDLAERLSKLFEVNRDEAFLSLEHLHEVGCLNESPNRLPRPVVSAKGHVLIRAVSD